MADPAPPSGGQSFGARMSRKVGPLPVWAWAVIILVVGYFLYKRFGTESSATGTSPASASVTNDQTPVPVGDQSGGGVGSASGSSGTQTPTDMSANGLKESPGGTLPTLRESVAGQPPSSGFHEQIGGFSSGSGQRAASGGFRAV